VTGLATLLTGPAPAGVYRLPAASSADTARRVAEAAGWRVVDADTSAAADRRAVFAALKTAFGFPDWFGHNLDALADSLGDLDAEPGTLLVWSGSTTFARSAPDQFRAILAVLRDRANDAGAPTRLLTLLA
jgi:RNAse (barnase) inhibitor barstar